MEIEKWMKIDFPLPSIRDWESHFFVRSFYSDLKFKHSFTYLPYVIIQSFLALRVQSVYKVFYL